MGWNTNVLFVRAPSAAVLDIVPDIFSPTSRLLDFEAAASGSLHPDFALGSAGEWAVLWDPNGKLVTDPETQQTLARSGDVLVATLSGVTSTYGITWYAGGELRRRAVYASGKRIEEEGKALPEEKGIKAPSWGYDEDWVLLMVSRLTGLEVDAIEGVTYQLITIG